MSQKDKLILVSKKSAYGRNIFTPENELGQKFAALMSRKTFTDQDVSRLKELGYILELKAERL